MSTLRFTALDTWFFRESRPMEAIGGSELASVFPPPPRTLLGALRSAIGDATGVDWQAYKDQGKQHSLYPHIGHGNDLGPLRLAGPWLNFQGERLYPVPLYLIADAQGNLDRLRIGQTAVQTHLGHIRLPEFPNDRQGYKPLERAWITGCGLERLLAGQIPDPGEICRGKNLFQEEPRLGIARDNARRTAGEGMLYQTRHLRPVTGLALEVDLNHHPDTILPGGLLHLGGEGHLALRHRPGLTPPSGKRPALAPHPGHPLPARRRRQRPHPCLGGNLERRLPRRRHPPRHPAPLVRQRRQRPGRAPPSARNRPGGKNRPGQRSRRLPVLRRPARETR